MTPDELLVKARRALASAELLLERGDPEGACNRAYYAMFDAARAGLLSLGTGATSGKSHSGLIAAFSLHWVKSGRVPLALGKAFNRAADLRLLADYTGSPIDEVTAGNTIQDAQQFLEAIEAGLVDTGGSSS
ncbi:HEPN domain-containing protein [uncultured Thiodictyon sp.]|uniref:HEPN domain-containing protein n=1 Tax=uncultured Thiodictyon sp. TaxID=1846217 RepID=UPI0025EBF7B5|nr:HEPN domain-containing protein [uncultured Thiodictyon sp.]